MISGWQNELIDRKVVEALSPSLSVFNSSLSVSFSLRLSISYSIYLLPSLARSLSLSALIYQSAGPAVCHPAGSLSETLSI